jgi:hypothetical protein
VRRSAWLVLIALCGVLLAGPPAVGAFGKGASSDPPTKPVLHPFRECSRYCDASYSFIDSTTPLLSAVSTDPDSASLTYTFTIEDYMPDVLLASEQFVARPGDEVRWQVPEGVVTGHTTYRWNVTVQDESTTVSDDKYFAYHKPDGLLARALGALEEPAFAVLLALPYVGVGLAVLGLVLLPWRRRAGLRMLLGGLAVAAIAVLILISILAQIGS